MKTTRAIQHQFVESFPEKLQENVLYVSIPFATVGHNCFCGCGNEVVTPLSPAGWSLTFNGKTVSLYPSIGNWNFECQSHYWIEKSNVVSARKWSKDEIDEARNENAQGRKDYFDSLSGIQSDPRRRKKN